MSEEWKEEFFEWKDGIESKFNNLSQKNIELEKKISDIDKSIDNRDIIPKGWAKSIDGYSKLKKQIDVLKLNQIDGTPNQNFVAIHILKNVLTQIGLKWDNWVSKIEDILRNSFKNKKQNAEKHLAELIDDPQIEARFIKACEKQIEDTKRQLEKLDSKPKKEKSEKPYLDLGMITSKNGELSDYKPSQFVIDYAKIHPLFSLYGLVVPEEDSGGEKEDSARHIQPCSNLSEVKPAGNQSENSKLPEFVCSLELQGECGNEGSMDCLKGNSKGERFDNNVCVHGKKELENPKDTEDKKIYRMELFPPNSTPFDIYQIGKKKAYKEFVEKLKKMNSTIEYIQEEIESIDWEVSEDLVGLVNQLDGYINNLTTEYSRVLKK